MLLAALQSVDKFYGEQVVLSGATLEVRTASKIALIGRNGAGKSTILRLLLGLELPDGGVVYRREGVKLGMLEQGPQFTAGESVQAVAERAFADLEALESELRGLERKLDEPEVYEAWERVHETFERRGGYQRRARREMVFHALGFRGREDEDAYLLSGGEKTRLGLARLLMAQPDVLLLDEPSNHLDMEMRVWLSGYLQRYPGGLVLVSHDRALLDEAADSTAEVALGSLRTSSGPPSCYRAQRAEQLRIEEATRANEQKELERLETMTSQMKLWAGNNAKLARRAKAMASRTERYREGMLLEAEREQGTTRFRFDCEPSAEIVLQAQHLSKRFGDALLFQDIALTLRAGERVALIGLNGAGKSSLLKMLTGELPSGDPRALLRYGARVRVGYYDQDGYYDQELRGVNPELTLLEEVIRLVGDTEAHNLLGRFLFPFEAQFKRVADLSGGERARLALLKLTLGEHNFLVLDEPTNHLDVEMIEALETALARYQGTLLLVSHDKRFIQNTTGLIWELREGRLETYEGDWDYYQFKRRERTAQVEAEARRDESDPTPSAKAKGPSKWRLERTLEELEVRIDELEAALNAVTEELADPDALDAVAIAELGETHERLERELLTAMAEWEEAGEQLAARA